ncbi:MAG: HDIG domain-containing protein [Bacteroidales bacterium]|nr:HDIG domain-containing protein [Bacteroidales bacterium]
MKKIIAFLKEYGNEIVRNFLFILSVILLFLIFPKEGKFKYEFQKGKPWMHADLIAPYDFAINKPEGVITQEKERIISQIKPYFIYDTKRTFDKLQDISNDFEKKWKLKYPYGDDSREQNIEFCYSVFNTLFSKGIIKYNSVIDDKPVDYKIILVKDNIAEEKMLSDFFSIRSAYDFIHDTLRNVNNIDKQLVLSLIEVHLIQNVVYNRERTEAEKLSEIENISITRGMVQKGERIISTGELVTNERYLLLESIKQNYEIRLGSSSSYYLIIAGQLILIAISIIVLRFFLLYFMKDVYSDNKKILLILLLIILMVYLTSIVVKYNVTYLYIVPICLIPIVIRAFFNTRLALYVHIIAVIIIGFLVPNSFEFVFSQLITGIIAVFSVVNLQRRSQFFLTSLMIFLGYSFIYLGLTLIQEGDIVGIKPYYFALFAGSATLTLFSYPLIYIFEKVFRLITDVTLIELSNVSNQVLRDLSSLAPGTFQHSLQVANLAEEAIFEIGGSALLVRTGALYHDIGKTVKPEYFTENQITDENPHDDLTFEESASIIIDHVSNGVEIAKKHNIPDQIIDFIRTHHGTRKVGYFYLMKMKFNSESDIDESKYTYPGPVPFSKETAVVMMADSVEAASRSIKKPDVEKISNLVEKIVEGQLNDNQFIYTNITLGDITRIKEIFKKRLMNIYHVRIQYPDEK